MDLVKPAEVFRFVEMAIEAGRKAIVANHNLHSLYLTKKDAEVRRFFEMADLIEIDSTPLIAWARLIGENSRGFHRCTYLDWRDDFWARAAAQGWRVYFLGGAADVAEQAADRIRAEHPGVNLATHHGYFDMAEGSAESAAIVAEIAAFAPQILLVGMGMPRQEVWIARNYEQLPTCVMFSVGGAFDYEAGVQKPCPRWMGRAGVEWLYRLASNPRRLFSRYCIEPWSLIGPALGDLRQAARRRRHAHTRRSEIRYLPPRPNAARQERKAIGLDG
jgi:N-acetylglucosaminyldiphosphoundecaprenol N-acetyl-beta-D-mannosaminyltransferase